jgi:hypothetical protein
LKYNVGNHGKLAAVIDRVSIRLGPVWNDLFPPQIIRGDHDLFQKKIIAAAEIVTDVEEALADAHMIINNVGAFIVDGTVFEVRVLYHGPFTSDHETCQCWQFKTSLNGFVEVSDAAYTYLK